MSNTKHFAKGKNPRQPPIRINCAVKIVFVLNEGSPKPPLEEDGQLRLYSMRFCPYAQRVHLVLDAKKIPYHTVNINLTNKPDWLFEAHPLGKVPCLQLVDQPGAPFVYESLLIAEYLDEVYPEPKLYPTDPLEKLKEKLWIERFTPIAGKFHQASLLTDTEKTTALWDEIQALLDVFEDELERRGTSYFGGDRQANILDYAIWPWFQRIEITKELFGADCEFSGNRYPELVKRFI